MSIELDYMEYADNAEAQAAYVNSMGSFRDDFVGSSLDTSKWEAFGTGYGTITVSGGECTISNTQPNDTNCIGIRTKVRFPVGSIFTVRVKHTVNRHFALVALGESPFAPYLHILGYNKGVTLYSKADVQQATISIRREDNSVGDKAPTTQDFRDYHKISVKRVTKDLIEFYVDDVLDASFTDADLADDYYFYLSGDGQTHPNTIVIDWAEVVILQSYSEDTIKQQGSHSLKVIAQQIGSLGETLTRGPVSKKLQIGTTTYDAFGLLIKTGEDTVIQFTRQGTSHNDDKGKIVREVYTPSTDSWGSRSDVFIDGTYDSRNVGGGIIGDHIYLFFMRYNYNTSTTIDVGYIKSTDLTGTSWGGYIAIDTGAAYCSPYGHIVPTSTSGKYLQPFYMIDGATYSVKFFETIDSGANWSIGDTLVSGTTKWTETCVAAIGDNKMIALLRNNDGGYVGQATSADDGETWSAVGNTNLGASSGQKVPWIFYDSETDNVIAIYHDRQDDATKISKTNAATVYASASSWNTPLTIDSGYEYNGYPSLVKIESGRYFFVYAKEVSESDNDTWGGYYSIVDLSDQINIKFGVRASRTGSNFKIGIHDFGGITTEHTVNIAEADVWQTETWDISGVANVDKDVIDNIIITILNADAENIFYFDNIYGVPTAAYTIVLEASSGDILTPVFDFSSGTIEIKVNDAFDSSNPPLETGEAGSIVVLEGDKVEYICSDWDAITKIDINGDPVESSAAWVLPTGLIKLDLSSTNLTFSVADWTLPETLTYLDLTSSEVTGSIGDWVLPAGLVYLDLFNVDTISGDITDWILPDTLEYFKFSSVSNCSADVSLWELPDSLVTFHVSGDAGLTGDIGGSGGWVLPTSLENFYLHGTNIRGDVSLWDLSVTNLKNFYVGESDIGGDISAWEFPDTLENLSAYVTFFEGDISDWSFPDSLKQVDLRDTLVGGDIGTNWDPNNITRLRLYNTSVWGDISGWTFSASLDECHIYSTSLDYDSIGGPFADVTKNTPQFWFWNCGLTEQQIDNILADCVTGGADDGRLDLLGPGGSPNSGPSVDGLDDVVILESEARGTWIVDVRATEVLVSAVADVVLSTGIDVHEEDDLSGSVDIVILTELDVHEEDNLSLFANLGLTGESDTEVEESEVEEVLVKGKGVLGSPQITNSQIIGEGDFSDDVCPQGQDCDDKCGLVNIPNEYHPGTKDSIINF